ncbi:DNA primase/helicase [Proteus phage PM2]|uniref:DnaB-like replicative helicase n=1 Tax=Proteus phage PM2 TaxID=2025809 RepID=A0A249XWI9_9CAUD|nr:AAA family ATPase [Proteus phage PM2]ASZ76292.1 DNA primase/helicase [Proteus phage PM2]
MVNVILSQLIYNKDYFVKVWPYLKQEYFDGSSKTIFNTIKKHVEEFKSVPTVTALDIALENSSLGDSQFKAAKEFLGKMKNTPEDFDWLIKSTEKYVQDIALYNAMSKSIEIQTNASLDESKRDKKLPDKGIIPEILQEALSICFDSDIGHDYFDDYEKRWLLYQTKANKVPFKLSILNRITKGGAEKGTLNILMAGVNVGKSLGLCSLAADYLQTGYNVLYISMEMAEHVCAKRIDANLLDVSLDDIDNNNITYTEFKAKMERLKKGSGGKTPGRLKFKQYPTGGANANTFRALLNELKLKDGFIPDIIIIDYLGICGSTRLKFTENSYTLIKAIAEELRGLAIETQTVLWTAAQTGRQAWSASDMEMADVAESAGLPATADFMLGVVETEELAQMGQQLIKQIKSRYGDKNKWNKFNLIVKKGNQRWVETDATIKEEPDLNVVQGKMINQAELNTRDKIDKLAGNLEGLIL